MFTIEIRNDSPKRYMNRVSANRKLATEFGPAKCEEIMDTVHKFGISILRADNGKKYATITRN